MSAMLKRPYTFMQKVESLERQLNSVELMFCCEVLNIDFLAFLTEFRAELVRMQLTKLLPEQDEIDS